MKPSQLREAIDKAIDEIMGGGNQLIAFEGVYKNFALVRSYEDALSLYGKDEFGNRFKLLTIRTMVGKDKMSYILYQMITIKDSGGFV